MVQYCVYKNKNTQSKKIYPYLLDVQSELLSNLDTRLVIPLALKGTFGNQPIKNLNPQLVINQKEYIILTQQMAAIPVRFLGEEVCDCDRERNEILSAIDFLITGF